MLYDPKWDREPPEDRPSVPVRTPLLWLMLMTPWIVLAGMVALAMNTATQIGFNHTHIGRGPAR